MKKLFLIRLDIVGFGFIFALFMLLNSNAIADESDLVLVIKGDKEQVLDLAYKAMQVQFSDGVFDNYSERTGYTLHKKYEFHFTYPLLTSLFRATRYSSSLVS